MDIEKFTERSRGFIQSAQNLALREGNQQFTPEHLLKVLLDDEQGLSAGLIDRAGGHSREALRRTEEFLAKQPKVGGSGAGQIFLAPTLARIFDSAEKIAQKAGDSYVTVERLLLALSMERDCEAARILKESGVTPQSLNGAIEDLRKGRTADSESVSGGSNPSSPTMCQSHSNLPNHSDKDRWFISKYRANATNIGGCKHEQSHCIGYVHGAISHASTGKSIARLHFQKPQLQRSWLQQPCADH